VLRKAGYDVHAERVDNAGQMQAALEKQTWDVVISDYSLPQFDAPAALALLQQTGLDIPFIVVSGTVGEDTAVTMMKAGVHDYLMKDKLLRLAPAVAREIREAQTRRERRRAEIELEQRAVQLDLINHISAQMTAVLELDQLLDQAAYLIHHMFNYHHVAIFLIEAELLKLKAVAGLYTSYFQAGHTQLLDHGINGRVATSGQKIVANDVSQNPYYTPLIVAPTVTRSELCLPLIIAGQTIGVLDIQSPHLHGFSQNDVLAMEALAHQLAGAMANARLYEQARQEISERRRVEAEILARNRELAMLNKIIAASAAGLEPEAVLDIACCELALAFEAPQATASLLNEQKTAALIVAEYLSAHTSPGQAKAGSMLNQTLEVAASAVFQYLLTHKTLLVSADACHDARLARDRRLILQRGTISLLILPLLVGGEVVGSLTLETTEPRHFLPEEINLAWSVADQVAGALSRARLIQTHLRLSAAIEQAGESVIITDIEGAIIYVNPTFERVSGYSRAEAIGQTPRLLKSGQHDAAFYEELWSTISAGQVWRGRFINKKKDGTLYTEEATIIPVRDESGTLINHVSVQRDVTRELQLEEQYRQAQKMEVIGQLTAGIAHDFNNLLTAINGFAELAQVRLPADHPLQNMLDMILRSGQHAVDLVRQLMIFSRKQVVELKVLSLTSVVADIEKMLRRIIGEDIILKTVLAAEAWPVKIDPAQFEQVIVNLAVNARDAMPNGGYLTIETANVTLNQEYAAAHLEVSPGEYALLAVSDNGVGMSEAVKAHIFEPFFTTKEAGKGTGLGLATVFGIVKQSDGHIWVYSEEGLGTTFKIYLPRVRDAAETIIQDNEADLPAGHETILLVEDNSGVREMAVIMLEQQGYTVLAAADGGQAQHLAQQHQGPIDLLLTDIVMPGENGRVMAEKLAHLRPGLRTLFMSGYTDEIIVQHGVLAPGIAFLPKPFTVSGLLRKVREVLDSPAPQDLG
ncbi:MAG: response regulator, partial [Chloroflexota bacterium]